MAFLRALIRLGGAPHSMKMVEGPALSGPWSRQVTAVTCPTLHKNLIFRRERVTLGYFDYPDFIRLVELGGQNCQTDKLEIAGGKFKNLVASGLRVRNLLFLCVAVFVLTCDTVLLLFLFYRHDARINKV